MPELEETAIRAVFGPLYLEPRRRPDAKERFWAKVAKLPGHDVCWEWTGARFPAGYGSFSYKQSNSYAHRVAYEFIYGEIPEGAWVLHHCDHPPCVRPSHLYLGTPSDNAQDRERKGRGNKAPFVGRGQTHRASKVTEDNIVAIRAAWRDGESAQSIAQRFPVGSAQIYRIIKGSSWSHVSSDNIKGESGVNLEYNYYSRDAARCVARLISLWAFAWESVHPSAGVSQYQYQPSWGQTQSRSYVPSDRYCFVMQLEILLGRLPRTQYVALAKWYKTRTPYGNASQAARDAIAYIARESRVRGLA